MTDTVQSKTVDETLTQHPEQGFAKPNPLSGSPPEQGVAEPGEEVESDEEVEEVDDSPQDGDVFGPGWHLINLAFPIPLKPSVVAAGLAKKGILGIRHDQSGSRSAATIAVREHRLVGCLTRPLAIHQLDYMRWTFMQPLVHDIGRDPNKDYRLTLEAFSLVPGAYYEALFLAKEKVQPTLADVEEHLEAMGFIPVHLDCLQRDLKLKTRPNSSTAVWIGLLEWNGAAGVVTEEDPFYFENLAMIDGPQEDEEEESEES